MNYSIAGFYDQFSSFFRRKNRQTAEPLKREHEVKAELIVPTPKEDKRGLVKMTQELRKYLDGKYEFRYNQLSGTTEFRELSVGGGFRPVDSRAVNRIMEEARVDGMVFFRTDIQMMVISEKSYSYNPFYKYMYELPAWDGTDRVYPLLYRLTDDELFLKWLRCWLRAMVSQWMGKERKHANVLVPILISQGQGMGKSTFARMLVPDELRCYYLDSMNINSTSRPEQKIAKMGLINLDEFDRIGEKQQAVLKNLLQMTEAYIYRGKMLGWTNERRLASFIGTTNSMNFLTDVSGSRRFICIEVKGRIKEEPIEYEQFYAQLKHEVEAGMLDYLLPGDERLLQERNKKYYVQSPFDELFPKLFRIPAEGEVGEWLSGAEMFIIMQKAAPAIVKSLTSRQLILRLRAMGLKSKHTQYGNKYNVVVL